jgi:8-oxo-dGTP pyrophosphatase MutT (NUDIX family)
MTADPAARAFRPLHFPSHSDPLGAVSLPVAQHLLWRGLLADGARLSLEGNDPSARLEDIRDDLFCNGWIEPPRHEQMPVTDGPRGAELARLDRSALRILGFWAQKVHINGLVDQDDPDGPSIWISRRSGLAPSNPGRWDTLVAGGRASGHSIGQTARQESWEEAGIESALMTGLQPVGDMAVQYVSRRGFHQELLVIYDLALPKDFVAVCHDGEIEESTRLTCGELTLRLADPQQFKFSSYLVLMDLVRRKCPAKLLQNP